MKPTRLPFHSNQPLRQELLKEYLSPAVRWIADVQDPANPAVLPVKLANIWETAIGIIILFRFKHLMSKTGSPTSEFDDKITQSVDFLLKKVQEDETCASWDGGLYDTSLAVRALLYYTIKMPASPWVRRIDEVVEKGILWLCREVEGWESERYSLGVADLAQVLQTILFWEKVKGKPLADLVEQRHLKFKRPLPDVEKYVLDQLVNVLPGIKSNDTHPITTDSETSKYDNNTKPDKKYQSWVYEELEDQDIWNISEAVMGLVNYYDRHNPTNETSASGQPHSKEGGSSSFDIEDTQRLEKVAMSIHRAVRYLELEHSDGKWGLPDTTSLALLAYLRGHSIWESLPPEPQIVFKTIRWLCDDKQRFADGSLLHSSTHTLFFCLCMLEVVERWIPAGSTLDQPVEDLYDFVLWQMPARTSAERAKRLDLQDKLEKAELRIKRLNGELKRWRESGTRWKVGALGLVWGILGIITAWLLGFLKLDSIPVRSVPLPAFSVAQAQVGEFLVIISIWVILGAIAAWRVGAHLPPRKELPLIILWVAALVITFGILGFLRLESIQNDSIPFPSFVITQWQEILALLSLWLTLGVITARRVIEKRKSATMDIAEEELENF